jgi:hypothetical protein
MKREEQNSERSHPIHAARSIHEAATPGLSFKIALFVVPAYPL